MAQEILCDVNNCMYWGSGNKCTAKTIHIVSQKGENAFENPLNCSII